MKVTATALAEVKIIEPQVFGDDRGFFLEAWNAQRFADAGLDLRFVQDNHSRSARHVLRGFHYQLCRPQGKLVRVIAGAVFDVAVDIRRNSSTFGNAIAVELTAENKRMLWVPPGFAHGFLALEDGTELVYKCTDFYFPEYERAILWSDPSIGVEWPLAGVQPILSAKDAMAAMLKDAEVL